MMKQYIARNQKPEMAIFLSKEASAQEKFAAGELRYYLGLITGAPIEIVNDKSGAVIELGRGAEEQGDDGFSIRTDGANLTILGGKRGVIYGAYEFLEKLGCRFFTALSEKIPACEELELPDIDDTQVPVLEYREHNYTDVRRHVRFAVKCRLNGNAHPIPEKFGGHMSYAWYVHTFEKMVPPEKYAKEHPEYYALVDGKRDTPYGGRYQLCLTEPGVLKVCIESVRQALIDNPEASIISISQNDWFGNCTCERCLDVDKMEGSPAGTLLRFVNAIAEALEAEFPHVIFDTLAYNYTRPAPKITRPRHNVCVRLCSIESCFAHPFETCDDDKRSVTRPDGSVSSFITDLRDWGKMCDRMYIWDYTTCFAHYPTPHPNWNSLQPNMRAFVKNNVKGVFEQANGAVGGGVDLNELRLYVLSKLLWDAETDVERHIQEFLEHYYGAAAPHIRAYMKALTDKVEQDNIHVGFNDHPTHAFLTDEMLDIYDAIFDQAEAAVSGDALRHYRVQKARLGIRYVRIKRHAMEAGEHDTKAIRDFFVDWKSFGLTRIDEWCDAPNTHRALIRDMWRGVEFFEHWTEEGAEIL